jgi:hypothetical protein
MHLAEIRKPPRRAAPFVRNRVAVPPDRALV